MRFLLVCMFVGVIVGGAMWLVRGENRESGEAVDLEKALTGYLQGRLVGAEEVLKGLRETGTASLSDLLAAEDVIDRLKLHLRLVREAKLVHDHPVLSELRRQFSVPEIPESAKAKRSEAVSAAVREYLEKKVQRAEKECERAQALLEAGRALESDVRAANETREGLKLLLEIEGHSYPTGRK